MSENKLICSLDIAKELEITHKTIINMITKYRNDFEYYRKIDIMKEKPGKGTVGGRPKRVLYLDWRQRNLLYLYLGNTKKNREHKFKLNNLLSE